MVYFSISAGLLDYIRNLLQATRKRNLVEGYPVTLRTCRQESKKYWKVKEEEAKELFVGRNSLIRIMNPCHLFLSLARSPQGSESLERLPTDQDVVMCLPCLASVIWDEQPQKINIHYSSFLTVQFPHTYCSFHTWISKSKACLTVQLSFTTSEARTSEYVHSYSFGHPTKYALFNPNDRKEKFIKIHIIYDIKKIDRSYCLKILVTRPPLELFFYLCFGHYLGKLGFFPNRVNKFTSDVSNVLLTLRYHVW